MERWHLSWVTAKELYTRRPLFFSSVVVQGGERKKRSDSILHDSPTPPVENTRRARIGQRWVQLKKKVKRKRRRKKCAAVIITRALGGTLLCCIHTSLHFFCCLVAACICWAVCSVFLTALLLATVSTTTGTDTLLGLARSFHLEAFFSLFLSSPHGGRGGPHRPQQLRPFWKGSASVRVESFSRADVFFSLSLP